MLDKLEILQQLQDECRKDNKVPAKYRKRAEKDYRRLEKDLDRLYTMYTKIRMREEELCKKWGIEDDL